MLSWLPYSLRPPISCVPLLLSTNWAIQWNTNQNIASWVTDLGPVTVRSLTLNAHASLKMSSKENVIVLLALSFWDKHMVSSWNQAGITRKAVGDSCRLLRLANGWQDLCVSGGGHRAHAPQDPAPWAGLQKLLDNIAAWVGSAWVCFVIGFWNIFLKLIFPKPFRVNCIHVIYYLWHTKEQFF